MSIPKGLAITMKNITPNIISPPCLFLSTILNSVTVENGPMKHRSSVSGDYKQHNESGITAKLLIHEQIRPKMLKSQIIRQSGSSLNIILTTALTNHSNGIA